MRQALLVAAVSSAAFVACGELLSTDGEGPATDDDAGSDSAPVPDDDAGPPCDLDAPFSTPVPVPGVNTPDNEGKPRISPDELTIHFTRNDGGPDPQVLFAASRSSPTEPFGAARIVPVAVANENIGAPTLSGDFLVLVYVEETLDAGVFDQNLFLTARANAAQAFGPPAPVDGVNSLALDIDPFLSPDARTLYFVSARGGVFDIWRTTRPKDGSFGVPLVAFRGETGFFLHSPVATADDQTLFFGRGASPETRHIYVAHRLDDGAFGPETLVPELNDVGHEEPGSITPDGCRIYIRSVRESGAGGEDIYVASRPPRR